MTELEYLVIGYVFFIVLIAIEAGVSTWRKNGRYRLNETIGNIGHGVVYQTFDYYTKSFVAVPFVWISSELAPVGLPMDAVWAWLLAVVVYDFMSYWAHRHSHEVHAMWAVHAVHHAAEDFNLAAALRQPLFSHLFTWVYRLPLALFMSSEMFIILVVFDYLYQFIQHTQYVPKLGPIGWLMNTPSHHRVHHGRDDKYLDKNYGGIFIIWDRLFGTFQAEEETPDYGLTNPVRSVDPIWGNFVFWCRLIEGTRRARDMHTRVAIWLRGPGDFHALVPPEDPSGSKPAPLPQRFTSTRSLYVIMHAMVAMPALPALIYFGQQWGLWAQVGLATFLVLSTTSLVGLLEQRSWARGLESLRLVVLVLGLFWGVPASLTAVQEMWLEGPLASM